jgi:MFS family permease
MSTATSTPASPVARPATYRSVFAVGEFRLLFGGSLMYVLGFTFEILGLSVLVYAQTRSAFLASFAYSMGFAPQVLGGAFLTALADRLAPRTVITAGLLLRAVPGLLIGAVPGLPVAVMLVLVAAAASIAPVFTAAISGLLADALDGDQYVLGRSALGLLSSSGQILGLGVAGAILAVLSARWLLLAAGAALVLSALIRRGIRPRPARTAGPVSVRGTVLATMAGNRQLLADRRIRGLMLALWLPLTFGAGAEALVVPYVGLLGKPASAAGPLLAAGPASMMAGQWVIGRFCRPAVRERLAFPLAVASCLPWLLFLARPPLALAAVAMFAGGFGTAYILGIQQPFLRSVPPGLRGQAFGLNSTGAMTGQGMGPWLMGALAAVLGPAGAMAASGVAGIACTLALFRSLTGRVAGPGDRG